MGRRGPPKTPTAVLRLRGSWRADTRPNEPRPAGKLGKPPGILGREARAEWRRVVRALAPAGVLTAADRAALAAYCCCWGELYQLQREVDRHGVTIMETTDSGTRVVRNPAHKALVELRAQLLAFGGRFGLNPSARADLGGKPDAAGDGDAAFFGEAG